MAASRPDRRSSPRRHGLFLLAALACAPGLGAQELAVAEMRGRVLVGEAPAPGALVVIHRVGPDESGPLDSLTAGRDGTFRYRLPSVPDPESRQEVFFASTERDGVNYFGPLVQTAADLDSLYLIRSYETEPAPVEGAALPISSRYLLLEQQPELGWTVTDLVHVENAGPNTLTAAPGGVTFAYPLPEGASDLEIGGSQMASDAAVLMGGSLRITSAIPPGPREFVVRYRVPDPYLTARFPGTTGEIELLVKEPAPALEVAGLAPVPPVEMEPGSTYRRFATANAQDLTLAITRGKGEPLVPLRWLAVGLAFLLATSALYAVLRPHPAVAGPPGLASAGAHAGLTPFEQRQRLLLDVARLDEARDAGRVPPDEWAARRRVLIERLRELG